MIPKVNSCKFQFINTEKYSQMSQSHYFDSLSNIKINYIEAFLNNFFLKHTFLKLSLSYFQTFNFIESRATKNLFFYFIITFLSFNSLYAKEIEPEKILVFSTTQNILVPNLDPSFNTKQIHLLVEQTFINKYLIIKSKRESHLFINNKYYAKISPSTPFSFLLTSKFVNTNDIITIQSIYPLEDINFFIQDIFKIKSEAAAQEYKSNSFENIKANHSKFHNIYIICIIIFLIALAMAKFLGIQANFFSNKSNSSNYTIHSSSTRSINKSDFSQLELIVLTAIICIFLTIIYVSYYHNFFNSTFTKQSVDVILFFIRFTVILILSKIVLHLIFGYFLKIQGFTTVIITEIYRFLAFFISFLLLFLFISFTPFYAFFQFNFIYKWILPFILFLFLFIREFYLLLFKFGFNKNYLFAYICICDLYPFVYILKLT